MEKHDLIRQYKKPLRVIKTPYPSFRQIRRMVNNLKSRLNKCVCIYYDCWNFTTSIAPEKDYFRIFIEDGLYVGTYTWEQLQDRYFELMGE